MSEAKTVRPLKQLLKAGPSKAEHQALVAERKEQQAKGGRPPKVMPTRDVAVAKQYEMVTAAAPAILQRLIEGALDRSDPLHERCLDIMAKRVAPIAFWEGLGKQEFRPDEEVNRAPSIQIIVTGTAGAAPAGEVIDVEPVEK